MASLVYFTKSFREELIPILLKLFQKVKKRECSQTYFTRTTLSWYQNQKRTLIEKKTKQNKTTTKTTHNSKPIFLINVETKKIPNKILANRIQQRIKRIIHYDQVEFIPEMQGWFNICKSMRYIMLIEWQKRIWSPP